MVTYVLGHLASPWEQVSEMFPSVSRLGMGWLRRMLRPCRVHLSDSFPAVGPCLVCELLWGSTVDLPASSDAVETRPHMSCSYSLEDGKRVSTDLPSPRHSSSTVSPRGWKRNPVSLVPAENCPGILWFVGWNVGFWMVGFRTSLVWAHGIFAVPCNTMTCTPEVAATSLAPSGFPLVVAHSAVLSLVSPHPGPPPHRACEAGAHIQCLCGTQPGWFLANPVSGVVWSKEEAEACVCWESEGSGRETGDGLQGQQIRLGRTGHLLPGFMFLEWRLLFFFLRVNNLIIWPLPQSPGLFHLGTIFMKSLVRWPASTWKDAQHHWSWGKWKSELQ